MQVKERKPELKQHSQHAKLSSERRIKSAKRLEPKQLDGGKSELANDEPMKTLLKKHQSQV